MKQFVIFIFFVGVHVMIHAQTWENQIPNYSQEEVSGNYPNPSDNGFCTPNTFGYNFIQDYWGNCMYWTHTLKPNVCLSTPVVNTPDLLSANYPNTAPYGSPRSGVYWGNCAYNSDEETGEILIVETKNFHSGGLKKDKLYFLEFFTTLGDLPKYVVAYDKQPKVCGFHPKYHDKLHKKNPSIIYDGGEHFNPDDLGWVRRRTYFSVNSDSKWITLGEGGFFDDVRIYEVGENFCRDNWYFDNTVFNYPFEFFQASDKIHVGNGVDPEDGINHIAGDVIQYANTSVVLQAQNQVIIENTFIMEPGSTTLIIENKPCQATLCPEALSFQNHILCDIPSMEIGTPNPNDWGTQITWSPSTHLSNPNISNPIFTVPAGSTHGGIQYTVTVKYTCDPGIELTRSYPVFVEYSNAGDPTATISASNVVWDVYNFSATFNFNEGVSKISISVPAAPGYFETFYKGTDFNCCSFSWSLPDAWDWSSCQNDVILVKATNMCSGQEQTITLQWPKTQIPYVFPDLPNVFSPNGNGVNDEYFVWVPSADYYSYLIDNRWGVPMNDVTIFGQVTEQPVTDNPLILWAPQQHEIPDGVYYLYLELRDLCGNIQHGETYFHLVNGRMQSFTDNDNYEAQTGTEQVSGMDSEDPIDLANLNQPELVVEKVTIYPNPNNGTMHINSRTPFEKVRILNYAGTLVFESNVNKTNFTVENLSIVSGIYFVEVYSINGVNRQRISVQRE